MSYTDNSTVVLSSCEFVRWA